MPDHELPDDPSLWPKDPLDVLGVSKDADERTIKRAYARLIRRFNPEHSQEAFRIIREAYDTARRQLEWRRIADENDFDFADRHPGSTEPASDERDSDERDSVNSDSVNSDSVNSDSVNSDAASSAASRDSDASREPRARRAPAQPREWTLACAGDFATAYEQLQSRSRNADDPASLKIQLYWLLTLDPSLDADRKPVDWLLSVLKEDQVPMQIHPLIARELELAPSEELDELLWESFRNQRSTIGNPSLLQPRWQRFAMRGQWRSIQHDLKQVEVYFLDHPSGWWEVHRQALLLAARSIHPHADSLVKTIETQLNSGSRQSLEFSWLLDQIEEEIVLHDQIQKFHRDSSQSFPTHLQKFINSLLEFVIHDGARLRENLLPLLAPWIDSPQTALRDLDHLTTHYRPLLAEVFQAIQKATWYPVSSPTERSSDEIADCIEDSPAFVEYCRIDVPYWKLRMTILRFCLTEMLDLDTTLYHLERLSEDFYFEPDSCVPLLRQDLPLRCLLAGHRLYWQ